MYNKIKPYLDKGLISEQIHPEDSNIRIYNYTQACQYEGAWDEVTTKCRGLIINIETGEHLSNPFPKFFNYEEHIAKGLPVPKEPPFITKKYDGWLGILYWLNGTPRIATRGSFTSVGAVWATEWLQKYINEKSLDREYTYIFEIICPLTKIVVNYDFEGLVLLAKRSLITEEEMPLSSKVPRFKDEPPNYCHIMSDFDMRIAERFSLEGHLHYETLKNDQKENEEGYVLMWPSTGLRLKIKFEEYVRLHKIITGVSAIGIWEMLRDNQSPKFRDVPDEFHDWVKSTVFSLRKSYESIEEKARMEFNHASRWGDVDPGRAMWAEKIKKMTYPAIGFAMLDNKDYSHIIWKMIRPKGQSVFKKDEL